MTTSLPLTNNKSQVVVLRPWDWITNHLWHDPGTSSRVGGGGGSSSSSYPKCSLNIVDMVLFEERPKTDDPSSTCSVMTRWLFRDKGGSISKKKDEHVTCAGIRDAFLRRSSRDLSPDKEEESQDTIVAWLLFKNGTRKSLSGSALEQLLGTVEAQGIRHILGLAGHVPGDTATLMYSHSSGTSSRRTSKLFRQSSSSSSIQMELSSSSSRHLSKRQKRELENVVEQFVKYLGDTSGTQVSKCTLECVLDAQDEIWVTHIPHLLTSSSGTGTTTLPHVVMNKFNKSEGGLMTPPLNTACAPTLAPGQPRCKGEFCTTPLAQFPGLQLQRWPADSSVVVLPRPMSSQNQEGMANLPQHATEDATKVLVDTGERTVLGYKQILLARAEMPFLQRMSSEPERWQEADVAYRQEFGRSNPSQFYQQVSVCPNCALVYGKIDRLRQHAFDPSHMTTTPVETLKVKSKSIKQLSSKQSLNPETQPESTQPEDAQNVLPSPTISSNKSSTKKKKLLKKKKEARAPVEDFPGQAFEQFREKKLKQHLVEAKKDETTVLPAVVVGSTTSTVTASAQELASQLGTLNTIHQTVVGQLQEVQTTLSQTKAELQQVKTESTRVMKEKDVRLHERERELEQQYLLQLQSQQKQQKGGEGQEDEPHDQQTLIDNIQQLNDELNQLHFQREREQNQLQVVHQEALATVRMNTQRELKDAQALHRSQEDELERVSAEASQRLKELKILTSQMEECQRTNVELQGEMKQLQAKKARPSSPTTTTMTTGSSTSIKLHLEETFRRKETQLHHQLEFYHNQLELEKKSKEELGSNVAALSASLESMKREKKNLVLQSSQNQSEALHRQRQEHDEQLRTKDTKMQELSQKIQQLHSSMTELIQDAAVAKKKEEQAHKVADKLAAERVEILQAKCALESLVEELETSNNSTNDELGRHQSQLETLNHQLQNEVDFVKKQYEAEIVAKEEVEQQCENLRHDFQHYQDQWKQDQHEFQSTYESNLSTLQSQYQKIRQQNIALEKECEHVEDQYQHLRQDYSHLKVEFRQTQQEKDQFEVECKQVKQALISAKEETLRERKHAQQQSERQNQSMELIKSSFDSFGKEQEQEKAQLSNSIQLGLEHLAQVQDQNAELHQHNQQAMLDFEFEKGSLMLATVVIRWETRQQATRFMRWAMHNAVAQTLEREKKECEKVHEFYHEQHQRIAQDHAVDCEELQEAHQLEQEELLQKQQQEHEQDLQRREKDWRDKIETERQELQHGMDTQLTKLRESLESKVAAKHAQWQELQEQYRAVSDEIQELESKFKSTCAMHQETRERWKADTIQIERANLDTQENLKAEFHRTLAQVQADLAKTHASALQEKQLEWEATRRDIQAQCATEIAALKTQHQVSSEKALAEQSKVQSQEMKDQLRLQAKTLEASWNTEREDMVQHAQAVEDRRQAQATQAWSDQEAQWMVNTETQLETQRREMNEIKGHALMQCSLKWQRAMEDLSQRLEVEKKLAYERGVDARELEWQDAAKLIQTQQEQQLVAMETKLSETLRLQEEKHQLLLQQQQREMKDRETHQQQEWEARQRQARDQDERTWTQVTQEKLEAQARASQRQEQDRDQRQAEAHARALTDLAQKHEQECSTRSLEMQQKLEEELDVRMQEILEKCQVEAQAKLEGERNQAQIQRLEALTEQKDALETEFQKHIEHYTNEQELKLEQALKTSQVEAQALQQQAISQVEEESDKLISKVEAAMSELSIEKTQLERDVEHIKKTLEETEDAHYDLSQECQELKKRTKFQWWKFLLEQSRRLSELQREHEGQTQVHVDKVNQLNQNMETLQQLGEAAEAKSSHFQSTMATQVSEMYQILVEYKREELMEHKIQSSVLVKEIQSFQAERLDIEAAKNQVLASIQHMEQQGQEIELQLREVSKTSSFNEGRVNLALATKKRRYNEELDQLLEQMEQQKVQIQSKELLLEQNDQKRQNKETELKALERQLVAILVEQQKKMLAVVNATKSKIPTSSSH